ncbi:DUF1676 domain-containing protein Osi18 [Rhodnius prolixus]|uniref:Uncharacterized protein n=1 Tax=Rhodnius prolixus TaxID=13249 RepID=T1HK55_RHOPR
MTVILPLDMTYRKLIPTILLAVCVQGTLCLEVLDCLAMGQPGCLERHLSQALSRAQNLPTLRITRHLTIVETPQASENYQEESGSITTLERLEKYLYGHSLKLELPEELLEGAKGLISDELLAHLPHSVVLPLAEQDANQGRGFIKKVVLPFLLGLKFKATAVIPIAMALIALKTWKALTLGLLSLVLTASMVIFRLTKPKVLNYEVYYQPPAPHHHHVDEHYHVRSARALPATSSNELPYRGYKN